jgi:hypothetical protein
MATTATYSAKIGAGGTGTATIQTGHARQTWDVQQVSVELPAAPIGATCVLRKNGYLVTPLIATGDVADGSPPVTLQPTDTLTVEWAGCTNGTVGKVLLVYEVLS